MSDSLFFKVIVTVLLTIFAVFVVVNILVPRPSAECKNPQTIMVNVPLPDGSMSISSTQVCE